MLIITDYDVNELHKRVSGGLFVLYPQKLIKTNYFILKI